MTMVSKHLFVKRKKLSYRLLKWCAPILLLLIMWPAVMSNVQEFIDILTSPVGSHGSVGFNADEQTTQATSLQTGSPTENASALVRRIESVSLIEANTANDIANAEVKPDQLASTIPSNHALATHGLANDGEEALRSTIIKWQKAWQTRDLHTYLSLYGPNFEPPQGLSRELWADTRKARIGSKQYIQLSLHNLSLEMHGKTATVKFNQVYVDERYRMNDRKTMVWQEEAGRWSIQREITD